MSKRKPIMPTPEEDAAIRRGIAADPDAQEWTEDEFKRARPAAEVFKELGVEMPKPRGRGPQKAPTKEQVAVRLDRDVLKHFRSAGPGWQTRMNDALKEWVKEHS